MVVVDVVVVLVVVVPVVNVEVVVTVVVVTVVVVKVVTVVAVAVVVLVVSVHVLQTAGQLSRTCLLVLHCASLFPQKDWSILPLHLMESSGALQDRSKLYVWVVDSTSSTLRTPQQT